MKKTYILFTVMFVLIFTSTQAQFKYGPRVSLGMSGLGGGKSSIAWQLGWMLNAELRDNVGVQGEVLFSVKKGYQETKTAAGAGSATLTRTNYTFSYIDIPLYGYFPLSKHITFLLGPQFSVVNKARSVTTVNGGQAVEEDVENPDTKMGFAAGIDFNLQSPLRLGLRFSTNGGEALTGKSTFFGVTGAYYLNW